MVGMAAMVGGGTGAAMTAVTMIFEMTRDYDIVMPMIVAVALQLGVRRVLSRENIYTIKLLGRGHAIPKALHANMFLVRQRQRGDGPRRAGAAGRDQLRRVPARQQGEHEGCATWWSPTDRASSACMRVNTGLRRAVGATAAKVTMGELAKWDFVVVDEAELMFEVIPKMPREGLGTAVVVKKQAGGKPPWILGVVARDQLAKAVGESVEIYPKS